jgi:hypothetical protein
LLGENVVQEIGDRAFSGSILSNKNEAVVAERNVDRPRTTMKALDLELL